MSSESSLTHRITKAMPKKELEDHIANFLTAQNMCVLATCSDNLPRATPIEYHSKFLTLFFIAEPGRKLKNIEANPSVSVGVFAPYMGWSSAKGVQISGDAKIIERKNKREFDEGLSVYQWQKTAAELGIKELPESVRLLRVETRKAELVDMSLNEKGYAARQILNL
jgi:nitroimidazol reductase NimA-like FMN-containing flavoprotein (pyridoxamine 5'-phosphate oxidase superfamily)